MIDWRQFSLYYVLFLVGGSLVTLAIWIIFAAEHLTVIAAATAPIIILLIVSIVTNQTGLANPAAAVDYFGTLKDEQRDRLGSDYTSTTAQWVARRLVPISAATAAVTLAAVGGILYWLGVA